MNDCADRLGEALKRHLARRFDQRAARRSDIVGEHRLTAAPCAEIGNLDIDAAVTVPDLSEHGERRADACGDGGDPLLALRSEEHTSELQSLMRISYAVFCLKK